MSYPAVNASLTKHPMASLKELISLSIPLILTTLSASLLGMFDRLFLSKFSLSAWEACTAASNPVFIFQVSFMIIASVSQAFVAHYKGANEEKKIGPLIWQMVYFSVFSMGITYPVSLLCTGYFAGSGVEQEALLYFRYLSAANFLFPLGASLASFFHGRGKNNTVLFVSITIQIINILLDYLLIFGVKGVISPLGIKGAAIATITAESLYCIILFFLFFQKKYILFYNTRTSAFNLTILKEILLTGGPRAFGLMTILGSWLTASYLLIQQGEQYLLVYTFGVTIFIFLSFINEGIGQALVTLISYFLGKNLLSHCKKAFFNALMLVGITLTLLAIPLFLFQETLISLFIEENLSNETLKILKESCYWIWLICLGQGVHRIGTGFITASKDTVFYALSALIFWVTECIPVYIGIGILGWSPAKFFMINGLNALFIGMLYLVRFFLYKNKKNQLRPIKIRLIST